VTATNGVFGPSYYQRYYGRKRGQIQGPKEVARLGAALVALVRFYGGSLRSVLEVGAGTGLLRDWFRETEPKVRYLSTEHSAFAAAEYGHAHRDITRWCLKRKFDLVVCQGVLPYLDDRGASAALRNLAAMSRAFLYVEAITRHDYDTACDRAATDPDQHFRDASFYRSRLLRHFHPLGGGLYYAKTGPRVFWELETLVSRAPQT
jgi:hypothetical protein